MKAMILAAGRGERLRPLTKKIPKPLIKVGGQYLIERHIRSLVNNGIQDIVVNIHHLANQIKHTLGNGNQWGANIVYSDETDQLRDTGGGIRHALPLLGDQPFLLVNGDVLCNYPLKPASFDTDSSIHLIMVDNPEHNQNGDFYFDNAQLTSQGKQKLTYSGIGYFQPELFANRPESFRLAEVIRDQIVLGKVSASHYHGLWLDVGAPQRLHEANKILLDQKNSTE